MTSTDQFTDADVANMDADELEDHAILVMSTIGTTHPPTVKAILLANDTIRWRLEANARELRVILTDCQAMRQALQDSLDDLKAAEDRESKALFGWDNLGL